MDDFLRLGTIVGARRAMAIARLMRAEGIEVSLETPPRVDVAPEIWEVEFWVEPSSLERAKKALALFRDGTLLEATSDSRRCGRCGYSLDALGEKGRCPECGAGFIVLGERDDQERAWRCPTCGERVPENFDSCWNCAPPEERIVPRSAPAVDPMAVAEGRRRITRVLIAIATTSILGATVILTLAPIGTEVAVMALVIGGLATLIALLRWIILPRS